MLNFKSNQIIVWTILVISFLLPAIPVSADDEKEAKQGQAAVVNGTVISTSDFEREFNIYKNRFTSRNPNLPPYFIAQLRTQVLKEIIDQELLLQASRKQKIMIKDEAVISQIDIFKKKFPTSAQFKAFLDKMGYSEADIKAQFAKRMAVRELIEQKIVSKIHIKDNEAKAYFDTKAEKYSQKEAVRARHILIKVDPTADEKAKTKARQELTGIKKRIVSGEDFATLAKTHSQGPSGAKGGDLGYFSRGQMVKPFEAVAFKLAVNEVSDIVETRFGYHLIKVVDRKDAKTPSFAEVKEKAIQDLRNERIQAQVNAYIGNLRESAQIETFVK
jgi:peptidyl-prolyl cis-trans isomerase C